MSTYRFGGNEFTNCSVPLAFPNHVVIVQPGPVVSIAAEDNGELVWEVVNNEPGERATKTGAGIITVRAPDGGGFAYKVRPGSETSIVFGTVDGGEMEAKISDRMIQVGGMTLEANQFFGTPVGVLVGEDGSIAVGAQFPPWLLRYLA